jgi:cysteinyl-tRNA synthetase
MDWSNDLLAQSKKTLDRLYLALDQVRDVTADNSNVPSAMVAALDDDLNTPVATAEIAAIARALNSAISTADKARLKGELLAAGAMLGVLQQEPSVWLQGSSSSSVVDAIEVENLIAARNAARKSKDFKEADRIRDQIAALGVVIEDRADGTHWRKAS